MDELSSWFHKQSRRDQRVIYLEDALLGDRFWSYAVYRLRYFLLRYGVDSGVHLLRYFLLFFIFSPADIVTIVLVLATAGLVGHFWWGSLEVMRSRVRHLRRTRRAHLISREIGPWLSFSMQMGAIATILTASWMGWRLWSQGMAFSAADLYVLSVLIRLALTLTTRCYHSGIYAIRRIYRPPQVIVGVELAGFAFTVAFWPWLGQWGFPIGNFLSTVISTAATLYYTDRSYRFSGFRPFQHLNLTDFNFPFRSNGMEWLKSGTSYSIMRLDALLILTLFGVGASGDPLKHAELFVLFFVISPTVRAGFDWAQLFYFDLKRLEIRLFKNLKKRFETRVSQLSLVLGLLYWGIASILATLAFQTNLGLLYLLLLPFFLSRSVLASFQMRAFSGKAYGEVLKSGLVLLVAFLALGVAGFDEQLELIMLSVVAIAVATLLKLRMHANGFTLTDQEWYWMPEWLTEINRAVTPVHVRVMKLEFAPKANGKPPEGTATEEHGWQLRQLANGVARRVGKDGLVTILFPDRILWYELSNGRSGISESWLIRQSGGFLQAFYDTGVHPDGRSALQVACDAGYLGGALEDGLEPLPSVITPENIQEEFERMFPDGIVYDPEKPSPQALVDLSSAQRRSIFYDAVAFIRDLKPVKSRSSFEVSALSIEGELRLIFLLDQRAPSRLRAQWRRRVTQLNLGAATASGPSSPARVTPSVLTETG